jgi:hypothetical protein
VLQQSPGRTVEGSLAALKEHYRMGRFPLIDSPSSEALGYVSRGGKKDELLIDSDMLNQICGSPAASQLLKDTLRRRHCISFDERLDGIRYSVKRQFPDLKSGRLRRKNVVAINLTAVEGAQDNAS